MKIILLADCTEFVPQLATWFRAEWADEIGGDVEYIFYRCTNTSRIPIGLVAVDEGKPVGTVQLLDNSVRSHPHLKPWIGGLYVEPRSRHRGVATSLIEAALVTAKSIDVSRIYIGVTAARKFYERSDWQYEEDGVAGDTKVMILSKAV